MEASDQQQTTDPVQNETRDRTPTKYHVLVEGGSGELFPVLDGDEFAEFEGRRPDVLEEVITGDFGVEIEEDGKSPWCYIIPARGFQRLRGSVKTTKSVEPEEG